MHVHCTTKIIFLLSTVEGIKVQTRSSFQLNCDCAEDINKHWLYSAFDKHIIYVCTVWWMHLALTADIQILEYNLIIKVQ